MDITEDIYYINPESEAKLTHVIAMLDDILEETSNDVDSKAHRLALDAMETIRSLPFFKRFD